jgi:hypothetical protein
MTSPNNNFVVALQRGDADVSLVIKNLQIHYHSTACITKKVYILNKKPRKTLRLAGVIVYMLLTSAQEREECTPAGASYICIHPEEKCGAKT